MKSIDPKRRARSGDARAVIGDIFNGFPPGAMRSFVRFFSASLNFLSSNYGDRWGITLFEDGIRLNVGWVEVLLLSRNGLRVLVDQELAAGATFDKRTYRSAPGCRDVTVPLSELPHSLSSLSKAHQEAISRAARRKTTKHIREAHSGGVTRFLSEHLQRPVPDPSYFVLGGKARQRNRLAAMEGKVKEFTLLKRERDPKVRASALAERGTLCEACGFDFEATYGDFAKDCVEVHHLRILAEAEDDGVVTSMQDVRGLCPNCHRALHHFKKPKDWVGFRKFCASQMSNGHFARRATGTRMS